MTNDNAGERDNPQKQRGLKENELWSQLANAISLRSAEDSVLWHIFGIFWAASALLLVALFRTGDFPKNFIVGLIIAGLGFSLSIAWCLIQRRALGHIERYEELVKRIENKLGFDPDYAVTEKINVRDYQQFLGKKRPRARNVMTAFSIFALVGWLALLCWSIYLGLTQPPPLIPPP